MKNRFIVLILLSGSLLGFSGCERCSGKLSPEAERAMNSGRYSVETAGERAETAEGEQTAPGVGPVETEDGGAAGTEVGEHKETATETDYVGVRPALPARLSDVPEQILHRKAYVASFNTETLMPNWVAWKLTAERADGHVKRESFSFHEDPDVDSRFRVLPSDYSRSGYDRGHMCPAGDNKWSPRAMEESFLMTNICPQLHSLNAGDWNNLEIQCRAWAREYGGIYIVCGPIVSETAGRKIGRQHRITVPAGFFKVILCMKGRPKAIGFIFKNESGRRSKREYVNTVDDVERITGMDFFPALPDSIENRVEAEANLKDW